MIKYFFFSTQNVSINFLQVEPDGLCMARAILLQVVHDPHKYSAEMLMRQAGMYMLRHPYKYYKALEIELLKTGESYESYCYNVFNSNIWGDDLIAAVIGDMWNVAISIITPIHKKPVALWHNKDIPDIVLVANGGSYTSKDGSTHFSATRCYDPTFKQVGSEYLNPTITQDMTAKMCPIIMEDRDKAKQVSLREFIKIDQERSLELLRGLCKNINTLDNNICEMIYESDKIRKQKETMEYQLEKIGVNIDRIKKATEELKEDRGYVRTGDREKYDEEKERKRKADETLREQEEKKQKTITVGEGEEVRLIEEDREQKLARQQQEIIRQQEILLQNQEQHILKQETRIRRMEEQKLQPQQPFSQTMSTSSRFKKPIATGGVGTIDKFLSAEGMRSLPKCLVKQEPTEEEEDEDVMITEVTKKTETVKYLPKAVPGIENLVLVQVPKSKTTAKRSSKAGPVPENLQDPKRFYCDKCEAHYK